MVQFFLQLLRKQTAYCPNTVKEHCKEKTKAYTRHMTNKISTCCREPKSMRIAVILHSYSLQKRWICVHYIHILHQLAWSFPLFSCPHAGMMVRVLSKDQQKMHATWGEIWKSTSFIGTLHKPTTTCLFFFFLQPSLMPVTWAATEIKWPYKC